MLDVCAPGRCHAEIRYAALSSDVILNSRPRKITGIGALIRNRTVKGVGEAQSGILYESDIRSELPRVIPAYPGEIVREILRGIRAIKGTAKAVRLEYTPESDRRFVRITLIAKGDAR